MGNSAEEAGLTMEAEASRGAKSAEETYTGHGERLRSQSLLSKHRYADVHLPQPPLPLFASFFRARGQQRSQSSVASAERRKVSVAPRRSRANLFEQRAAIATPRCRNAPPQHRAAAAARALKQRAR